MLKKPFISSHIFSVGNITFFATDLIPEIQTSLLVQTEFDRLLPAICAIRLSIRSVFDVKNKSI
ncbi:hypothetical protein AY599_04130 [Leptolyngbya valderiana BDU 20041]|nr:hypothetical protein AY599_04130 [Leptolyngbya valderiana BDU 20041]